MMLSLSQSWLVARLIEQPITNLSSVKYLRVSPLQVLTPEYIPTWFGPVVLFFGMLLVLGGGLTTVFPELTRNHSNGQAATLPSWFQFSVVTAFVLGGIFATIGALRLHGLLWLYIAALYALGRALEATSHVNFYVRLYVLLTERQWVGSTRGRLLRILATLFVTLTAITIVVYILAVGPFTGDQYTEILIIWTVWTFLTASIGAAWKFRHLHERYRTPVVLGMILLFAGAEVYNLRLFNEFVVQLIGGIAGTIGFWFAAIIALRQATREETRRSGGSQN